MARYLKRSVVKGKAYYCIADSFREDGKVRTVSVKSLGPLSDEDAEYWRMLFDLSTEEVRELAKIKMGTMHTYTNYRHGITTLAHVLWHNIGFNRAVLDSLGGVPNKGLVAKLLEVLVLNRLEEPTSELGTVKWLPKTSLPFLLGILQAGELGTRHHRRRIPDNDGDVSWQHCRQDHCEGHM